MLCVITRDKSRVRNWSIRKPRWRSTAFRYAVLPSQSERELSDWDADRKVTAAACAHAVAGPDAADAALVHPGAGESSQSNAPWSLCILRRCRQSSGIAAG